MGHLTSLALSKLLNFFNIKVTEKSKREKLALLDDTIKYYAADPENRRCRSSFTGCKYSPESIENSTSQGCAIGRLVSPEKKLELDLIGSSVHSSAIMKALPKEIRAYGSNFLAGLQTLHDSPEYWDHENNGLSCEGVVYVNHLKKSIKEGNY